LSVCELSLFRLWSFSNVHIVNMVWEQEWNVVRSIRSTEREQHTRIRLKSRVELDRLCVVGYVVLSDFVFCSESS